MAKHPKTPNKSAVKAIAPTKATSGEGFNVEDKVAASCAVALLLGRSPVASSPLKPRFPPWGLGKWWTLPDSNHGPQVLNLKRATSPSWKAYSLPSSLYFPASRAAATLPSLDRSA